MKAIGVIPARWASTRFEGKVLAELNGKPIIQHVFERSLKSKKLSDVLIACDDDRVLEAAKRFGAKAVMTSKAHESGTDRIAEAIKRGISIDEIYRLSRIDRWFLYKLKNIIKIEEEIKKIDLVSEDRETIQYWFERAKRFGFSDGQISSIIGSPVFDTIKIRKMVRKEFGIHPYVKQIDTLAAEWPAQTRRT